MSIPTLPLPVSSPSLVGLPFAFVLFRVPRPCPLCSICWPIFVVVAVCTPYALAYALRTCPSSLGAEDGSGYVFVLDIGPSGLLCRSPCTKPF